MFFVFVCFIVYFQFHLERFFFSSRYNSLPAYIRKCNFYGKVKKKIVVGSLIVTSFQKHCCRLAKAIELYFVPVKHNKCLLPIDGDSIFSYFDAFSPMMPSQQAWYNGLKLILKEHVYFHRRIYLQKLKLIYSEKAT